MNGKTLGGVLFDEGDFFDARTVEKVDPRIAAWWARGGTTAELLSLQWDLIREKVERDLCPLLQCVATAPPKLNRHQRRAAATRQRLTRRDDARRLRRALGRLSVRSQTTGLVMPEGTWIIHYPRRGP